MAIIFQATKDPAADLDYQIDWTSWLGTDQITASTWTAPAGCGLTLRAASIDNTGKKATVWLSGGNVSPAPFAVVNHITTAASRQDERSIMITVQQR